MIQTDLEDERIGIHFNNPENRRSITESIEIALSEYDRVTVNRTGFVDRSTTDTADHVEYDCKLEVVFDLIEEGSVVVKEEILSNISEEIQVEEDFNIF